MNLANKLTIARICLVPFFILFMELRGFFNTVIALVIFCAASITDFFDGHVARKQKTVTSLGIFLDPLADKLLISSAFICFVSITYLGISAWMVIAIISREFLITGLRSIAAYKNVIIPADKSGKFKTTSQIIVIITVLVIVIINEAFNKYFGMSIEFFRFYSLGVYSYIVIIIERIPYWFTFFAVIFTIFSGAKYVFKYRNFIK
ncbi:MAG: CDP-diacylglycerol--glycerol-3-phosphate 3-phosphatidyltransferase [Endomicrobium sp.]|nr:CDP-diacylglycerol--glycerol-3-phosphate 3-phosphatidyltransferase [Endomicrobium sp.]MDR2399173.1 CDP-diacylglycerol--glycerol-3-phosphate 3-phosphatidyltransferase [Endomicrobium sp.]